MYGFQLFSTFESISALGIVDSQKYFSTRWCGMSEDLLRDYHRRGGANARVKPSVVARVRERLAEVARLLPELAAEVHEIDAAIVQHMYVADLLGRRSLR
ncbi:hypothetical protein FF100_13710 [Methylobacterium terricola]|uniref:Uncharacterized protein n=1 Tax=Methylobacterium terricola TaxID=2583531 RepID=A0A5C4LFG8_9HYPH|nr:hypothetical protein [Methylobacterium terricola]TNC12721.1 hypothetical protein FF100_13710 [Methylobacterium terricola]